MVKLITACVDAAMRQAIEKKSGRKREREIKIWKKACESVFSILNLKWKRKKNFLEFLYRSQNLYIF